MYVAGGSLQNALYPAQSSGTQRLSDLPLRDAAQGLQRAGGRREKCGGGATGSERVGFMHAARFPECTADKASLEVRRRKVNTVNNFFFLHCCIFALFLHFYISIRERSLILPRKILGSPGEHNFPSSLCS